MLSTDDTRLYFLFLKQPSVVLVSVVKNVDAERRKITVRKQMFGNGGDDAVVGPRWYIGDCCGAVVTNRRECCGFGEAVVRMRWLVRVRRYAVVGKRYFGIDSLDVVVPQRWFGCGCCLRW